MPDNNLFTTSHADTLTKIFVTQVSTFSESPETILGNINKFSINYGDIHIKRPIADPYQDAKIQVEWNVESRDTPKILQDLDLVSIGNSIYSKRIDYFGDPENVQLHVGNQGMVFNYAVEKMFVEGFSAGGIRVYGVADHPNATVGTVNRPEMAGAITSAGSWSGAENIIDDLIASEDALIAAKFYGRRALLAPLNLRPILTKPISYTSDSVRGWIKQEFGLPILYSPFVHEGAASSDFNCYLVDLDKINFLQTEVLMDAYYVNEKHRFYWDWETYGSVAFDPLNNGTEYLKGVVQLTGLYY